METETKLVYNAPLAVEIVIAMEENILSGTGDDWIPGGED